MLDACWIKREPDTLDDVSSLLSEFWLFRDHEGSYIASMERYGDDWRYDHRGEDGEFMQSNSYSDPDGWRLLPRIPEEVVAGGLRACQVYVETVARMAGGRE